ncbi:hypothetical protein [Rhodococcus sp. B10]|uniref:hypothetical protein n=1 Tax=Rhodococcus sp. B10 TaxID=2695876 RepID=UPI00142F426A|nr:hypothetical protein [Rhodococcus sp. B10]NIL74891.1 hypothetical protein [Rhodococcus sp. B10]
MTVQFFDFDVETPDQIPLRVYLIDQNPPEPRTHSSTSLLQTLGDRFAASPRLDGLLRVEVVAVDSNHAQHVLFDSAQTPTIELLRPTELLAGRFRRPATDLTRRVEDGLSIVVLPGELVDADLAERTSTVNDVQPRLVWIEGADSSVELAPTHSAWSASRTVAETVASHVLESVVGNFVATVVEASKYTAAEWAASSEVSSLVDGMSYVVA